MFYTKLLKVLAVTLGLAVFVSGCMLAMNNVVHRPISAEIFKHVLPFTEIHLQNENYIGAYRSILMEQNKRQPASLQEVAEVAEIRSFVGRVALNKAITDLRKFYFQGHFEIAQMSANEANFVCEMEGWVPPDFLVRMNYLLTRSRQQLYNLERDPPDFLEKHDS